MKTPRQLDSGFSLRSDALLGHPLSADVWKREQIDQRLGVTRGSLRIGSENQALQVSL